jgi:choline dehydrogenase-like flavoprotein
MDLKAGDRDGWEIPWPIAYADIAPYYDQVEQLIGVCGGTDDSEALPGSRFLQPPPAPRCGERLLPAAAAAEQTALLTRLSKEGNSDGEDRIGIEFFEAIKSDDQRLLHDANRTQAGARRRRAAVPCAVPRLHPSRTPGVKRTMANGRSAATRRSRPSGRLLPVASV